MERLADELRLGDLGDVIDLVKCLEFFRGYENRHLYEVSYVRFNDTIKMLDGVVRGLIKGYEKEWSRKIPMYLLRRYVNA